MFKPGDIGNPNGIQREKLFLATLKRAIAADNAERLRAAAEKLLDLAAQGEYWAVQMLADRLDGKPKQQLEALDGEGRSVAVALITYSDTLPLRPEALPAPQLESPRESGITH